MKAADSDNIFRGSWNASFFFAVSFPCNEADVVFSRIGCLMVLTADPASIQRETGKKEIGIG